MRRVASRSAGAVLACAAALCVVLTGCSGAASRERGSTATTGGPTEPVRIAGPADGTRVRARESRRGARLAKVALSGSAGPGATVFVRGGCRPHPCLARTLADARGRWTATFALRTVPSVRFVTIDAGPDRALADGTSVVTVELYGPRRTVRAAAGPGRPRGNRATHTPPARVLPREVLLIGDSLAVGIAADLKAELRGWRVTVDGRVSRPLQEGLQILAHESSEPAIVAFSLFSNNDPRSSAALEQAVRATAGRQGSCAVWATIAVPAVNGVSYDATNAMLRRLAHESQLALSFQLVDWASAVDADPSLVGPDHVHGTPQGYATLAHLYALAIRACAGARPG